MHQPSQTQRGLHGRSAFTHIHPLLQLFLPPQWTSFFQLTTIAGSYCNPSQLQVQKRVSNIWKVLLRSLGSFLSGAAEDDMEQRQTDQEGVSNGLCEHCVFFCEHETVIKFVLRAASTLQTTTGEQRTLHKFSAYFTRWFVRVRRSAPSTVTLRLFYVPNPNF